MKTETVMFVRFTNTMTDNGDQGIVVVKEGKFQPAVLKKTAESWYAETAGEMHRLEKPK